MHIWYTPFLPIVLIHGLVMSADNHYFIDGCTPGVPSITADVPATNIKGLFGPQFNALLNEELCKWTSWEQKYGPPMSAFMSP
jgi:hypothetical protein